MFSVFKNAKYDFGWGRLVQKRDYFMLSTVVWIVDVSEIDSKVQILQSEAGTYLACIISSLAKKIPSSQA